MSTFFVTTAVLFVVFAGLYAIGTAVQNSTSLRKRFAEAGNLRGRTKADIIAAIGRQPNSVSAQPHGKSLLQWMETLPTGAYHIALLFDAAGVCEGVTHEHNTQG